MNNNDEIHGNAGKLNISVTSNGKVIDFIRIYQPKSYLVLKMRKRVNGKE